ncbi:AAA family ATPase [Solihabitans fulvus]|uniref:AAA family ATPase n=1 Tax=Solihabitans fulvus TaxID=1892852 RepID=A0A5B2XIN5_9PSEU|nr:LuxR family transcriptional regulator [Solihabitans fulvus]KAA2262660.1 AAA family ATPase [Solihabitans fulvus]
MRDNAWTMVGRDAQLRAARELLVAAPEGARRLLFDGPSGIGKTSLLRATAELAAEQGLRVALARAHPLEQDFAFGIIRQLIEPRLAELSDADRLAVLGAEPTPASRVVWGDPGVGEVVTSAVLPSLGELVRRLARRAPLLVAIDDLQWADAASLRLLDYLAERTAELPLVFAATVTSGEVGGQQALVRAVADRCTRVPVEGLCADDAAALAAEVFGRAPEPGLLAACLRATDGNPFLLRELTVALADDGIEPTDEAVRHVREFSPRTVSRWVLTRMRRCGTGALELARAVAVLGDGTTPATAAELAGLSGPVAETAVEALARMRLLAPDTAGGLRFAHSIVRNAVGGNVTPNATRLAHQRAARLLHDRARPTAEVAAHLLATDPVGEAWAAQVLTRAGREAAAAGSADASVTFLGRALAEPATPAARVALLAELGRAELCTDLPTAVEHLREVLDQAEDPSVVAGAARDLALGLHQRGEATEALAVLERAGARLAGEQDTDLADQLTALTLGLSFHDSSPARVAMVERLRRKENLAPDVERFVAATIAMHRSADGDSMAEAVRSARRLMELGPAPTPQGAWAYFAAAGALCRADEFDLAEQCAHSMIAHATRVGLWVYEEIGHVVLSRVAYHRGRLSESIEHGRIASGLLSAMSSDRRALSASYIWLAECYVERADFDAANEIFTQVGLLGAGPRAALAPSMISIRGLARASTGDARGALSDHLEHGRVWLAQGQRNPAVHPWRSRAALAHHRLGEHDLAHELALEELNLARRWGAARPIGTAARVLGVVRGGEGIDLLAESAELLGRSQARLEYAHTLLRLGIAHHRKGRPGDARANLLRCQQVAMACGAGPLAAQAAAALDRMGTRRTRSARFGADALSEQEKRIATLAAAGQTNRQIAEQFHLTLRTVETHLTSTYRKLDIAGRRQLAGAIGRR